MCRLGAAYFVHARSSGRCTLFKSRCFTWFAKAHAHGHKTYRQTDRLFNTFILICRSFRSMPRPGLTRPKWWFRCRHPSKMSLGRGLNLELYGIALHMGFKMLLRRFKTAPRRLQDPPRRLQDAPRRLWDAFRRPQDASKRFQDIVSRCYRTV